MNKVLENIKNRRSIRQYHKNQIKDDELDMIIEAAIYAPTGGNEQPWHFAQLYKIVRKLSDQMNVEAEEGDG